MNDIQKGLIALLKSAVTGQLQCLPEGFSLQEALPLIARQHLVPLAYEGALNCAIDKDTPQMQKLFYNYYRQLLRSERQMRAIAQIYAVFEENNIAYLPLKGCNMKWLYPRPELRIMGDADILIRMEEYDRIVPLMEQLGYCLHRVSLYDYEWKREDLFLELHKNLVSPEEGDLFACFGSGWDRAVKTDGNRYAMSPEDTFLYLFVHMTKHYRNCGIGSRHMLDLYVYRRANPGLDEARLEAELDKLQLLEFYRNIGKMLAVWFEDAPADPLTDHITDYVFSGGSFGSMDNGVRTQALRRAAHTGRIRNSRQKTLFFLLFPPLKSMRKKYRILERCPGLLPLLWILRWFEVLLLRPGKIGKRLHIAADTTDEAVTAREQALRLVGLNAGSYVAKE